MELKARHPDIPLMAFPRGASYALVACQEAGYDVVTLDTQADRKKTRELLAAAIDENPTGRCSRPATVQGNLDVIHLQPGSSVERVREEVSKLLDDFGPQVCL